MKLQKESYSIIIMLGHMCCDLSGSALPAILPFLIVQQGISYTAAAGLSFGLSIAGSVIQPLFGNMADRHSRPWMMSLGIFLSGCGIPLLGFLENYALMFAAVVLTGIGTALFHPDGGRMANYVSGKNKGKGISNFSVGGNMGSALGPVLAVAAISLFGMHGTALLFLPPLFMSLFLLTQNKILLSFAEEGSRATAAAKAAGQQDDWKGFWKLLFVIFMRSTVAMGLTTFIPLFWLSVLKQTESLSGTTTTIVSVVATISTLFSGRWADRYGFNRVIRIGLVLFVPFMIGLSLSRSVVLSTILLIPASFSVYMAFSPGVALGQKLLPNHIGLASGVTMGLATSFGGVIAPVLGRIGDSYGMEIVLWLLAAAGLLAAVGSFLVPEPKKEDQ